MINPMRPAFRSTLVRLIAAAAAGILTLGLVTVPPATSAALPRTEVHAVSLAAVTAADVGPAAVTADDSAAPADFLAFAASILAYLNSLGLGAGPGLAAIGLTGVVVAFAATAYAWNGFANTVNPGLRFLRLPRVPKFPVCFAGQVCASSAATVRAQVAKPAGGLVTPAGRGVAGSKRAASDKRASATSKVRTAKKPTSSTRSGAGKGRSAR